MQARESWKAKAPAAMPGDDDSHCNTVGGVVQLYERQYNTLDGEYVFLYERQCREICEIWLLDSATFFSVSMTETYL